MQAHGYREGAQQRTLVLICAESHPRALARVQSSRFSLCCKASRKRLLEISSRGRLQQSMIHRLTPIRKRDKVPMEAQS